jgi:hypothetical protein
LLLNGFGPLHQHHWSQRVLDDQGKKARLGTSPSKRPKDGHYEQVNSKEIILPQKVLPAVPDPFLKTNSRVSSGFREFLEIPHAYDASHLTAILAKSRRQYYS